MGLSLPQIPQIFRRTLLKLPAFKEKYGTNLIWLDQIIKHSVLAAFTSCTKQEKGLYTTPFLNMTFT